MPSRLPNDEMTKRVSGDIPAHTTSKANKAMSHPPPPYEARTTTKEVNSSASNPGNNSPSMHRVGKPKSDVNTAATNPGNNPPPTKSKSLHVDAGSEYTSEVKTFNEQAAERAEGDIIQDSSNRLTCQFTTNDQKQHIFNATLVPAMPEFAFAETVLRFEDTRDLTVTYSYSGYIGAKDVFLTIKQFDRKAGKSIIVATIKGELKTSLRVRHQVNGSGTWM